MWPTARCGAGRATFAAALAAVCLLGGSGRPVRPHPPARELPTSPVSFRAASRSALSGRAAHRVPAAASTQLVSCRSLRPCRPAGPHLHPQTHQHPHPRPTAAAGPLPQQCPWLDAALGARTRTRSIAVWHPTCQARRRRARMPSRLRRPRRRREACAAWRRVRIGEDRDGRGWKGWKHLKGVEEGGTRMGVQVSTGFRFGGA